MESKRVPVTREGLERLKAELDHLKEVRRPAIVAAIAEAHGGRVELDSEPGRGSVLTIVLPVPTGGPHAEDDVREDLP